MPSIDELLAHVPMDQVARRLGVSSDEAEQLTRKALPALLGGMEENAKDPQRAASLTEALGQHDNDLLDGGVDLDQADVDDGRKIVGHVFGDTSEQVVNRLGAGGNESMMSKLLPMLAPLAMSFLAKQLTGGSGKSGGGSLPDGLGDILGGLTGGGSGGGIGDLLGGLLGGGRR